MYSIVFNFEVICMNDIKDDLRDTYISIKHRGVKIKETVWCADSISCFQLREVKTNEDSVSNRNRGYKSVLVPNDDIPTKDDLNYCSRYQNDTLRIFPGRDYYDTLLRKINVENFNRFARELDIYKDEIINALTMLCVNSNGRFLFFRHQKTVELHVFIPVSGHGNDKFEDRIVTPRQFDKYTKQGSKCYIITYENMIPDSIWYKDISDIYDYFREHLTEFTTINDVLQFTNIYENIGLYKYLYGKDVIYMVNEKKLDAVKNAMSIAKNDQEILQNLKDNDVKLAQVPVKKYIGCRDNKNFLGFDSFTFDCDILDDGKHIQNKEKRNIEKQKLLDICDVLEGFGIYFSIIEESRNGYQLTMTFKEDYVTNKKMFSTITENKKKNGSSRNTVFVNDAVANLLFNAIGHTLQYVLPIDDAGVNSLRRLRRILGFHLKDDSDELELCKYIRGCHYRREEYQQYGLTLEDACKAMIKLCDHVGCLFEKDIFERFLSGTLTVSSAKQLNKIYTFGDSPAFNYRKSSSLAIDFIRAEMGDDDAFKRLEKEILCREISEGVSMTKLLENDPVGLHLLNCDTFMSTLYDEEFKQNKMIDVYEDKTEGLKNKEFWKKNKKTDINILLRMQGVSKRCVCSVLNKIYAKRRISFYNGKPMNKSLKKVINNWKEVIKFCENQGNKCNRAFYYMKLYFEVCLEAIVTCMCSNIQNFFRNGFVVFNPTIIDEIIHRRYKGTKYKFLKDKHFALYMFNLMKALGMIKVYNVNRRENSIPVIRTGRTMTISVVKPYVINVGDLKKKLVKISQNVHFTSESNLLNCRHTDSLLKKKYHEVGENISANMKSTTVHGQKAQSLLANRKTMIACSLNKIYGMNKCDFIFNVVCRSILMGVYYKFKDKLISGKVSVKYVRKYTDNIYLEMFKCFDHTLVKYKNKANGMFYKVGSVLSKELAHEQFVTMRDNLLARFDDQFSIKEDPYTYKNKTDEDAYCNKYYFTEEIAKKVNKVLSKYDKINIINESNLIDVYSTKKSIYDYFKQFETANKSVSKLICEYFTNRRNELNSYCKAA